MDTIKPLLLLAFIVWTCYPVYAQTCAEEDFVIVNEDKEYLRINSSGVFGCNLNLCNGVQSLSINNGEISISNGNTLNLPDPSPTNEIQELSVTNGGNTLSISNGNSVDLSYLTNPTMLRVEVATTLGPYSAGQVTIPFDLITIDTAGGYNTTSSNYLVKTPGWYQVSGSLYFTTNTWDTFLMGFYLNGASRYACRINGFQTSGSPGGIFGGSCSDLINMNINDTFSIQLVGVGTKTISTPTVFSLLKISN